MPIRVGINGMGRIGRGYLRYALDHPDLEVVAVNDLMDAPAIARLLRFDSTFGPLRHRLDAVDETLLVDGAKIAVSAARRPDELDWGMHGVQVVIEATGKFRTGETAGMHRAHGASRVLISAPGKAVDATIVMGVNEQIYRPDKHFVISNASCTTNCVAPMVKVLHEAFGIERGFMTTVHAYTNDQNVLDGPHKDARRARSAAVNIIPTTTGAARAVGEVLPELAGRGGPSGAGGGRLVGRSRGTAGAGRHRCGDQRGIPANGGDGIARRPAALHRGTDGFLRRDPGRLILRL